MELWPKVTAPAPTSSEPRERVSVTKLGHRAPHRAGVSAGRWGGCCGGSQDSHLHVQVHMWELEVGGADFKGHHEEAWQMQGVEYG